MKDKGTEEKLYREAYKLFISRPYELVTVRDLEKAINKTRGAIFYYVKDKENLFRKVIEHYYLKAQSIYNKVDKDILEKNITLLQFIDVYVAGIEMVIGKIYADSNVDMDNPDKLQVSYIDRFYISLMLNAGFYLNDFNEKMDNLFRIEEHIWVFFIRKGIEKGEIKPDTDVKLFSELFNCIYLGKALRDSLSKGINTGELKDLFLGVYNIIKV